MGLTDNSTTIPRIMVFRPTFEEMKDFTKYLEKMESEGANKAGLAKIIPPPEWCPRKAGYDNIDLVIKAPIQQVVTGGQGLYQQYNIQKRSMSVKDFKKVAESNKYCTPQYFDYEDLERKYWKTIAYNPAIYGADVPGTLTDEDCKEFNINNLNTILDMINSSYGIKIMGVNTAYLYFGMWKTTFAWHTEDMDLYSINYLHFGAPKSWYCVPPEHGKRLERLANGFFPTSYKTCNAFLRHKMTLISPQVLKKYSIPYNKITQESGEFMITFPYAYHAGYNHGYNCAESTNFALSRWVEFGKRALRCLCRPDAVKISMEAFVKRFQPERYELWLEGKDVGPDPKDLSHICAAPAPSSYELNVMSKFGKHKRHPPHKKDYSSDTEEYNSDQECVEHVGRMFAPPTKAARKMFESDMDSTNVREALLTPSIPSITPDAISLMPKPPSISDTILRLHKNLNSSEPSGNEKKKRKKKSKGSDIPPHMLNHSYAKPTHEQQSCKPYCTQPKIKNANYENYANLMPQNLFLKSITISPEPSHALSNTKSEMREKSFLESPHTQTSLTQVQHNLFPLGASKNHSLSDKSFLNATQQLIKQESNVGLAATESSAKSKVWQRWQASQQTSLQKPSQEDECQAVPPLIKPYYECSPLDNVSPSSQPPLLDPAVFDEKITSNGQLEAHESKIVVQKSRISKRENSFIHSDVLDFNQTMVEASTSTEDLEPINSARNTLISSNQSNDLSNGTSILEDLSRKTLQYIPPTFGPSPEGFADEMKFNLYMSTIKPHCAVCNLLRPFELDEVMNESQLDSWSPPKTSTILIPSIAFTSKVKDENTLLDSRESSPLIVCMDCRICVHSVCYGASDLLFDGSERNWKCDRCEKKQYFALCCLCPLRGGPLKETINNKWVHLSCALLVPYVKFVNGIAKKPVDLSELKAHRKSERGCAYCRKNHPENKMVDYLTGYCIQCTTRSCYTFFHVTCGHRHGVLYQAGDWPDPIVITCKKCSRLIPKKKQLPNSVLKNVEIGEKVIAKHKNSRYYVAKVIEKIDQVFHHIHFVDNSFTENLKSCDILNRDCERDPPEIGDPVEVIWNKEQLHGKYSGNHVCKLYSIMFDDGSQNKTKREDFYLLNDELPKGVQKKMSRATDMQHLLSEEDSNSNGIIQ